MKRQITTLLETFYVYLLKTDGTDYGPACLGDDDCT